MSTMDVKTINGKLLLTDKECSDALSISRRTFRRLVESGDMPEKVDWPGRGARWSAEQIQRAVQRMVTV
jgi:predicted DNA-binding transcriptional regulator AlpA